MEHLKFHRSLYYILTILFPQCVLGILLFNAFQTPENNSFSWSFIPITWSIILLSIVILILVDVQSKLLKKWLLPLYIIVVYCIFLNLLYYSSFFDTIPYLKAIRANYEIIPLYFTIPGMLHALMVIIYTQFSDQKKKYMHFKNFAYAMLVPISIYFFVMIILPLCRKLFHGSYFFWNRPFFSQLALSFAATLFLFLFLRFILGVIRDRNVKETNNIVVGLFGLVLPFAGLALNADMEIFGDFNFILIYIAVLVNGIGLFLIQHKTKTYKIIGFLCTCFGLSYVLYFFMVFVPYIPIAFIAVIALGIGILMLTPTILLLLQLKLMQQGFIALSTTTSKQKLLALGAICFFILPLLFHFFCVIHKNEITTVLAKTYDYDVTNYEYTEVNTDRLDYILHEMNNGSRRRSLFSNADRRLPILSMYYDWYVFDNQKLSSKKRNEIETLYFGSATNTRRNTIPPTRMKDDVSFTYTTTYDETHQYYKTQLDLTITNIDSSGLREFATNFSLPEDAFITDYYLDIEDRREFGILAEKSAANWIYDEVTRKRKDPGILQYTSPTDLSLKIYPFKGKETRTSGFTILHKTSLQFQMNATTITIPVTPITQQVVTLAEEAYYIPAVIKNTLPKTRAKIQYYFLVDNTTKGAHMKRAFNEDYKKFSPSIQDKSTILYVDADVSWNTEIPEKASGINYAKALGQIIQKHKHTATIPYVIVYADIARRFLGSYTPQTLKHEFPYSNLIEAKDWDKEVMETIELVSFSRNKKQAYFRNNSAPELVNFGRVDAIDFNTTNNPYYKALQLGLYEKTRDEIIKDKRSYWLKGLRESFVQQILTRSTTYISLETEDQKKRMLDRQKQIIENTLLNDASVDFRRMSEPHFWLLLLTFVSFIIYKRKKAVKI